MRNISMFCTKIEEMEMVTREKHKRRKIFSRKPTKYDAQRAARALNFSFSLSDKSTGGLSWNLQVRLS